MDTFANWISTVGETVVAERLSVSRQIVNLWLRRKTAPRPTLALRIILMAKNWKGSPAPLGWEDIYQPFARALLMGKKSKAKQSKKR